MTPRLLPSVDVSARVHRAVSRLSGRRWLARAAVCLVVLASLAPTAAVALAADPIVVHPGTIDRPVNGTTVIAVQGFKFGGRDSGRRTAYVVGVGPAGGVEWVYSGERAGLAWIYDVDPLANGTLLLTGTKPGRTVVTVWNPETGRTHWSRTFPWHDTHDVDLINGDQLLVARMRAYNETSGVNEAGILVYDRSRDAVVWEWQFRRHGYAPSGGKTYTGDWTHANDVDKVGPGRYLVSNKNFDQVVLVDRTTGAVTMRLGRDEALSTLDSQHNPQYLRGAGGRPTLLVADSGNNRVVEYARVDGQWRRTWTLTGTLNWPRDADRLPNGNTLVTDSRNHRVLEVTPDGEVVWSFYAPWTPYDAERLRLGDEAGGPTTREQNATGRERLTKNETLALDSQRARRVWTWSAWLETPDVVRTAVGVAVLLGWVAVEAGRRLRVGRGRVSIAVDRFT